LIREKNIPIISLFKDCKLFYTKIYTKVSHFMTSKQCPLVE